MKKTFQKLFWVVCISFSLSAGNPAAWTPAQVDGLFNTLYSHGAEAAMDEAQGLGVTAYDFGIDLVLMGSNTKALEWFNAMVHASGSNEGFLFGKAWVLKEKNDLQAAMQTANQLLEQASSDLIRARAHYLLGVIHWKSGSRQYAELEFSSAENLYTILGRTGGINLCQPFLNGHSKMDPPGDPPRDDGDA